LISCLEVDRNKK